MIEADANVERSGFGRFLWINSPVIFCLLASIALVVAVYNYSFYYYNFAKDQAISQAQETIRRVVMDVSQVFYSYDSILKSSIALLGDEAIAILPDGTKNRLVSRMVAQFPYVTSVVFLDVGGAVRISSGGDATAEQTYGLADFFREQVSGALVGPYLAFTMRTWFDRPDYQVAISRRMTYDGQFKGVAVVFIRLSDFRDQFTNINIGAGNMIALVHESGHILTRKPSKDGRGDFGIELPKADKARFAAASEGTFVATSPVDGRERLFVFQRVPDWPLDLVFGVPVSAVYGEWRHRMTLAGMGAALVCAGFLFLGFRLRRERIRRVDAEAALEQLSVTDFLTGLANRRRFDEVLQREFRRALRTDAWLSVVIIDADRFKALNDRHGHSAGDETLKRIAAAITQNVRRVTDLAARLGGEEFAIVLPDTSAAAAFEIVERIRLAMEASVRHEFGPPSTTLSAGIASTKDRPPPDNVAGLLEAADQALYRAKHGGRNRTELAAAFPADLDDATASDAVLS
ncbi:GGDEF domain-containing protein [Azorhizobium doebereinerae]|uniref:GGDEF domain-containing protein n=1 Tax=Azorhizobium doebereinerae TaxID=281091 RepID=UPI0003F86F15|nr:sensor domain-containing diguanylate cyclase [Azorhizobium doebereinerae]